MLSLPKWVGPLTLFDWMVPPTLPLHSLPPSPSVQIRSVPFHRLLFLRTTRLLWRAWPTSAATSAESTSLPSMKRGLEVLSQHLWRTAGWTLWARRCRGGPQKRRPPSSGSSTPSLAPPSFWSGLNHRWRTLCHFVWFVSSLGWNCRATSSSGWRDYEHPYPAWNLFPVPTWRMITASTHWKWNYYIIPV